MNIREKSNLRGLQVCLSFLVISLLFYGANLDAQAPEYVPGEILVKFKPGVVLLPPGKEEGLLSELQITSPTVDALLSTSGVTKIEKVFKGTRSDNLTEINPAGETVTLMDLTRNFKLSLPATANIPEVVAQFSDLEEVEYAEPNHIYHYDLTPNDPLYPSQWHLNNTTNPPWDIGADEAWDIEVGAINTLKIGILDSGIDYLHIDLGNGPPPNGKVILGYDFANNDNDPWDDLGHGTAVAGLASALTNNNEGVAGVS